MWGRTARKAFTGVIAASGVAGAYMVADEERRARSYRIAQASYRISNLVGTVGIMCVDYGYTIYWGPQNVQHIDKHTKLNAEITDLQTKLDNLVLEQFQTTDRYKLAKLQDNILNTRVRIDALAEEVAQLSAEDATSPLKEVHDRSAIRLRDMCERNQGVYIKLGQHLAMLDHLLPEEYHTHLSTLLANNPRSPFDHVRRVVKQDLGAYPEEIFETFEAEPIASASLAQVHIAYGKDGKKYAVKVQHEGLREGSQGDMMAVTHIVDWVSRIFEKFDYKWLTREMNENLPKELDFMIEASNLVRAADYLKPLIESGEVAVPTHIPSLSSSRVLTMEFEEGSYVTDLEAIQKMDLNKHEISRLVSKAFCEQIYRHGFVHCDPHEANLLVRKHPWKKGHAQIVLLDHGLYKELNEEIRMDYCYLWRALVLSDEPSIKENCLKMNAGQLYPLLAAMLTMKPWDDIISSDINRLKTSHTKGATVMLRAYGKRYFNQIVKLLRTLPSEILLLLKTNDCLRHIDRKLGTPINTIAVVAGTVANVCAVDELKKSKGVYQWPSILWKWWRVVLRSSGMTFIARFLNIQEHWNRLLRILSFNLI